MGNFLTSWKPVCFSRRALLLGVSNPCIIYRVLVGKTGGKRPLRDPDVDGMA
jgi:hypothetical protein